MANRIEIVVSARDQASGILGGIGGALKNIFTIAAGFILHDVIGGIANQVKALGKEAILGAARIQEMDGILTTLGTTAGFTQDEINAAVSSIEEMGISTIVSRNLVAEFARNQLNLGDATNLARVAQDAATLSMEDSSTALDGLIDGIVTQNTLILRTHGIYIDAEQAMEDYAKTLGKTKDDLSQSERQQAVLNAVLENGTTIAGAYEAAMKTAGKQMRSLTDREFPDMLRIMGKPLLEGFTGIIEGARKWVAAISKAAGAGGELEPILERIGKAFDKLVKVLFGSVDIEVALTRMGEALSSLVTGFEDAIDWGMKFAEADLAAKVEMIGDAIADFDLPGITQKFKDWVAEVNWESLSQDFAAGMNKVDWAGITKNVLDSTVNIMQAIIDIIERTDWSALDVAIYNALVGVLRDGIGRAITEAWTGAAVQFWKAVDGILGTRMGAVSEAWASGYNATRPSIAAPPSGGLSVAAGGMYGAGFRAAGGWAGGMTMVGETGPEMVRLPRGSYVKTAGESAKMGGGGFTFVYSPMVSMGNRAEAETVMAPIIEQVFRRMKVDGRA